MSVCNHDFRDMAFEINYVRSLLDKFKKKYPDVKLKFCGAVDAFKSFVYGDSGDINPVYLDIQIKGTDLRRVLHVKTVRGEVFGPQPFLSIQTKSGRFSKKRYGTDRLIQWRNSSGLTIQASAGRKH